MHFDFKGNPFWRQVEGNGQDYVGTSLPSICPEAVPVKGKLLTDVYLLKGRKNLHRNHTMSAKDGDKYSRVIYLLLWDGGS